MSGGDLVLVRESAEDLFPADPVLGEVDLRWPGVSLSGCELAEGTVRPAGVVMLKVLGQHLPQMMLIDDQQPVEEFPAQGADDSLADRVCSGRLRRAGENPDAVRLEYGVEGAGELAGAIPDQKLDRSRALPEVHQEVARRLCRPRAVGVRGEAGQVNAASGMLDDDQGVDTPQEIRPGGSFSMRKRRRCWPSTSFTWAAR